jgi:hypothetical protein
MKTRSKGISATGEGRLLPSQLPMAPLSRSFRSDGIRWLLGLTVLTLCSWGRWYATGSLKIDENYPSEKLGTLLLLAMCIGWGLLISGWIGMLTRPPEQPRRLVYAALFIVAWMLPLLSNDIFILFAQASLTAQGQDVYTSAQSFPTSVWFSWIGERWRANPSPYGPLTLIAAWPSVLGHGNPWLVELYLRLAWLVPLIIVMELSFRAFRDRPMFHVLVWLNPLFMVEGPGQLHPDLLGVIAITAGLLLRRRAPGLGGSSAWALATLCKWNLGFTLPWFWLSGTRNQAQRLWRAALLALSLLGMGAVFYAPFWRGPETLFSPLRALAANTMVPGGSVVDCVGVVATSLRGDVFDAKHPLQEPGARPREARASAWKVAQWFMQFLALAAIVPLVLGLLRGFGDERLAVVTGAFIVALLTLASPKFQSWYLMSALPFFGLSCPPAWRRWWVWVVATSVTEEFSLVLPRTAALFAPCVAISTVATALVFLLWFRARFWGPLPLDQGTPVHREGPPS